MRKILLLLVINCTFVLVAENADSLTDADIEKQNEKIRVHNEEVARINAAVNYHIKLFEPIYEFQNASYEYMKMVMKLRRTKALEEKRQELITIIGKIKKHASNSQPFNGDSTLLNDFKEYLDLVYLILKKDFDKIVDMEDISERSFDKQEEYEMAIDSAYSKLHGTFDQLKECELKFSKKYNIKMNEKKDLLDIKIEKANNALSYYDKINRLVSRSNRYYSYAKKAIENKDVTSLEQHLNTVKSFSEEGIENIDKIGNYDGSSDLIDAAKIMLQFYFDETQNTLSENIEFILTVDKFNTVKKKFDAMRPEERTKKVVDKFNEMVRMYNDAISNINNINKKSYKDGTNIINDWNKASEQFFEEHS